MGLDGVEEDEVSTEGDDNLGWPLCLLIEASLKLLFRATKFASLLKEFDLEDTDEDVENIVVMVECLLRGFFFGSFINNFSKAFRNFADIALYMIGFAAAFMYKRTRQANKMLK